MTLLRFQARQNFEGCFERLWLNNTNVIFQIKSLEKVLPTRFDRVGNIYYSCPVRNGFSYF